MRKTFDWDEIPQKLTYREKVFMLEQSLELQTRDPLKKPLKGLFWPKGKKLKPKED